MPKTRVDNAAEAFGTRLVEILTASGRPRRGAGAYLAQRYKVAVVTANAWLNGEHRASTTISRRLAEDHGSSFEYLYFGEQPGDKEGEARLSAIGSMIDLATLTHADEVVEMMEITEGIALPRASRLERLAETYNAAIADGGKVSVRRMTAMMKAAMKRREERNASDGKRSKGTKRT